MRLFIRFSAILLSLALLLPAAQAASIREERVCVMVLTEDGVSPDSVANAVPELAITARYSLTSAFAATIPASRMAALRHAPGVVEVTGEASFLAPLEESTPGQIDPSILDRRDSVIRSSDSTDGAGTVIAVIDSGFDVTHPVFALSGEAERRVAFTENGMAERLRGSTALRFVGQKPELLYVSPKIPFAFDYEGRDTDVSGRSVHGTHVAATAAGSDAADGQLSGVAPGAQLFLLKVFDDAGEQCRENVLVTAVEDAVYLGADVINLSLGTPAYSAEVCSMRVLADTLARAEQAGVLVICAAGNDGHAGLLGQNSDYFRAADTDYGLPSEPASIPRTVAAAAAANSVSYASYLKIADRKIVYSESYEAAEGKTKSLSAAVGGRSFRLSVIPGVGQASDYADLSVNGHAVLIRRGEITFEEKVRTAQEAGAALVLIYDSEGDADFLMSVGSATSIPAAVIAREDGMYLSTKSGSRLTVSDTASAFPSQEGGIASYSSRGPTSDLILSPEVAAVGSSVLSAIPGGGYGVMSGTSMAAPQISGMAARLLEENRTFADTLAAGERAALWKAYLMNTAAPMVDENGVYISPRAQGAGMVQGSTSPVLIQSMLDGSGALLPGDRLGESITLPLRLIDLSGAGATLYLRTAMITDRTEERDGVHYLTGQSETLPHAMTVSGAGVSSSSGRIAVTVAPGGSVEITVTLTPDGEALAAKKQIFTNGLYLEGYILFDSAEGDHIASMPYMGFCGNFSDAPMIDAMDWDGGESYYGGNRLVSETDHAQTVLGQTPDGVYSALFAFSPDGDGRADTLQLSLAALRNIEACLVEILSGDEVLSKYEEQGLMKAMAQDGVLLSELLFLWDGSDGYNSHFRWAGGEYTVRLTLYSYAGGMQIFTFPVYLDSEKPAAQSLTLKDGTLHAVFSDDHYLRQLRIYLPHPEDGDAEHLVDTVVDVPYREGVHEAEISAAVPPDVEYVYVSAEDYAGNVTLLRYYLSEN